MGNITHFTGLTPAEAERVALLLEEAGEVVQICGKILRHGFDSHNPDDPKQTTNRELLEKELGDMSFASFFMAERGDISEERVQDFARLKNLKVGRYLHHQEDGE